MSSESQKMEDWEGYAAHKGLWKRQEAEVSWIWNRYAAFLTDIENRFCSMSLPVAVFHLKWLHIKEGQFCFCFVGYFLAKRAVLAPEFMCSCRTCCVKFFGLCGKSDLIFLIIIFSHFGISSRLSTSLAFFIIYKRKAWRAILSVLNEFVWKSKQRLKGLEPRPFSIN